MYILKRLIEEAGFDLQNLPAKQKAMSVVATVFGGETPHQRTRLFIYIYPNLDVVQARLYTEAAAGVRVRLLWSMEFLIQSDGSLLPVRACRPPVVISMLNVDQPDVDQPDSGVVTDFHSAPLHQALLDHAEYTNKRTSELFTDSNYILFIKGLYD
jgi:hypothetical protein